MTSPRHAQLQQQSIQSAIAFHRQGQIKEAERLYNDVLKRERNQFDALHLLGLLRYQQGRYSDAQLLIASALTANSGSVAALTNYGLALDKLGRRGLDADLDEIGISNGLGHGLSASSLPGGQAALRSRPN